MAKRRKLEAPSAADLSRIEEELKQGEVSRRNPAAPIAQVAAESAGAFDSRSPEVRAADAKDRSDAQKLRDAEAQGRVMVELPINEIEADALVRDRVVLDAEELEELKRSIAKGGLRLPIEVFEMDGEGAKYGLLSGYRRLKAVRDLAEMTGHEKFDTIKAVIRDPEEMGGTFAAMVEENEIRSALSHYERGRIAVIAAQKGAFVNTEEAVAALFPMASKAKRSKIRSFSLIFEELGDMLTFPDQIKEKDGLKLAAALRDGAEEELREALAVSVPETPAEEAAMIAEALSSLEAPTPDPARGGRPRKAGPVVSRSLKSGIKLEAVEDAKGYAIRVSGKQVDRGLLDTVIKELEALLDAP